jgi:hypothetical protein
MAVNVLCLLQQRTSTRQCCVEFTVEQLLKHRGTHDSTRNQYSTTREADDENNDHDKGNNNEHNNNDNKNTKAMHTDTAKQCVLIYGRRGGLASDCTTFAVEFPASLNARRTNCPNQQQTQQRRERNPHRLGLPL